MRTIETGRREDIDNPLVSVIMPAFNSEKYIDTAIESVISQTYDQWELIICDDGSTDNTLEIANGYQRIDRRVRAVKNIRGKGASGARNSALELARGRYIAFLDSDDYWYPHKLAKQIQFMVNARLSFTFSHHDVVNEDGTRIRRVLSPRKVNIRWMRCLNFIPCVTAMYDSEELGKVWQPEIKKRNDYALWLTILRQTTDAWCVDDALGVYRSNDYGLASGGVGELLRYYFLCIRQYGGLTKYTGLLFLPIYLIFIIVKKKTPSLYNFAMKLTWR